MDKQLIQIRGLVYWCTSLFRTNSTFPLNSRIHRVWWRWIIISP